MEARALIGRAKARINIRDCYKAWPSQHRTKEERVKYIDKVYKELKIDDLLRLSSRYSTVGSKMSRQEAHIVINLRRTADPWSNPNVMPFEILFNDGSEIDIPTPNFMDLAPSELKTMMEVTGVNPDDIKI